MIRFKINKNEYSTCNECNCKWLETREMYDIKIFGKKQTICSSCLDDLLSKVLTVQCMYNSRLKNKQDIKRANNESKNKFGYIGKDRMSINEALKGENINDDGS